MTGHAGLPDMTRGLVTSVTMAVVKTVHGHEGEVTGLVKPMLIRDAPDAVERGGPTLLLGIDGLAVEQVELVERGARVAHVVTAEAAAVGSSCG